MVTTRRAVTIGVLVACIAGAPLSGTVAASEPPSPAPSPNDSSFLVESPSATHTRSAHLFSDEKLAQALVNSDVRGADVPAAGTGQWGPPPPPPYYGHHHGHNGASTAAMIFGSAAIIAGTGLLIYSNRPECDFHVNDCYGEKVFGGSLLAGGVVSLVVGIMTWH